ncbi:MAG: S4 domain-containing protein [Oscillospiraceae bacterium]
MQRLDKILSEAGVASRKELKSLIRTGRVKVNGAVVRPEEKKFDEKTACTLTMDGAAVEKCTRKVLLMLHKPAGYVTSTDDPRDRPVMELIPERFRGSA